MFLDQWMAEYSFLGLGNMGLGFYVFGYIVYTCVGVCKRDI